MTAPPVLPIPPEQYDAKYVNDLLRVLNLYFRRDSSVVSQLEAAMVLRGTGSPEGVVVANVGALYARTDGAAGETLYTKESGDGTNTGWIANPDPGEVLFADMLAPVGSASVPPSSAPTTANFGPAHTPQRREWSFAVNEYVFIQPFHVNHDIKPNGRAYLHVHWSTNGTNTGLVAWQLTFMRALGHNQANFVAPAVVTLEQAGAGTAWRHMIVEAAEVDVLTLSEPDELIIVTLRRVAPSVGSNTDTVFGLMVDLHYELDRRGTPNKAPNFYT